MPHKPKWFRDGYVYVSFAPTVGINKDGEELYIVDQANGTRTPIIDDRLLTDVETLIGDSTTTATSRWVDTSALGERQIAVPNYFDSRPTENFEELLEQPEFAGFSSISLGDLIDRAEVVARVGHGSPSADLRSGEVPYIKVSDLRAGQVNINPTNRVSTAVASRFWKGPSSGLEPFDILTPIRTSKNIGDFSVLMPGQEQVVLTKEILVLHASDVAPFDNFYLLWAMSLAAVRRQWDRYVFMQTNREDVGDRYRQVRVPVAENEALAMDISVPFRDYYMGVHKLRESFNDHLTSSGAHHVFLTSESGTESEPE